MAQTRRLLGFTFQLGKGDAASLGFDTIKVSGLRASARIEKIQWPGKNQAEFTIFGLDISTMNRLSTIGQVLQLQGVNFITAEAGDTESGMSVVFQGAIYRAFIDAEAAPDVGLRVFSQAGYIEQLKPSTPKSFPGNCDVVQFLKGLATEMNLRFENSGVSNVYLRKPYFYGSPQAQAQAAAHAANISITIDDGVLAIWPIDGARGTSIPVVSKDTGLRSYPTWDSLGLNVSTLFNPSIGYGSKIHVDVPEFANATGDWTVYRLFHELDTQVPHGLWFTDLKTYRPHFDHTPT